MNDILCEQLARDYCCSQADVLDNKNHFTEYSRIEGRRQYHGKEIEQSNNSEKEMILRSYSFGR